MKKTNLIEELSAQYRDAGAQRERIAQELATFQGRLPDLDAAVTQAERKIADAEAQLENALTAEVMTAANTVISAATRELETARRLRSNVQRRIAELTQAKKDAVDAVETARRRVWQAKSDELVDEMHTTGRETAIAAFAALCAARNGAIHFSDFVAHALSPDGATPPPGLDEQQARLSKQLGVPA